MNWNDTRCEGEQEERIQEMLSDKRYNKLNYLKMDMQSHFRAAGMAELGQIKIVANPQATARLSPTADKPGPAGKAPGNSRKMSQQTSDYLNAIAASAPPSLKEKLERLARHGKK